MGSTTIRLDEAVYERLRARKRDDESFSEAVDRLLNRGSLLDLVGLWSAAEVEEIDRVLDDADATTVRDVDAVIEDVERG